MDKPHLASRKFENDLISPSASSDTDLQNPGTSRVPGDFQDEIISDSPDSSREEDRKAIVEYSGFKGGASSSKKFTFKESNQPESERSQQFTQESCSADEDLPHQYSARISKSSKGMLSVHKPIKNPTGSTVEYDQDESLRIARPHLNQHSRVFLSAEQVENRNEQKLNSIQVHDIDEELKVADGVKVGNQTINFSMINPASPFKASAYEGSSDARQTSSFPRNRGGFVDIGQDRQQRESQISLNQSAQNSNNLMSHEYSYSPDFRDASYQPYLDHQFESFSPQIPNPKRQGITQKQSSLPQEQAISNTIKNQGSFLRYEEYEGDCYTTSSQNNQIEPQIFFSGGTQIGSSTQYYHGNLLDIGDRKYSERMSDRIYDRPPEQIATGASISKEDESSQHYVQAEYDLSPSNQPNFIPNSPNNFQRNQTLSIITEEETQNDRRSVSQYFRMGTNVSYGAQFNINNRPSDEIQRSISGGSFPQPQYLDQDFFIKSKSQPMTNTNRSIGNPRIIQQTDIPNNSYENNTDQQFSHRNTISNVSQNNLQLQVNTNGPFPYHKSYSAIPEDKSRVGSQRLSYELKQNEDNDSYLQRLQSQDLLMRQSAAANPYSNYILQNKQNYDQLISEEDLLSNLDKQSRLNNQPYFDIISDEGGLSVGRNVIIPNSPNKGGLNFDEANMLNKIREQNIIIEQLSRENQELKARLKDKDLEIQNLKTFQSPKKDTLTKSLIRDQEIQVSIKKSSKKDSSSAKGTYKRFNSNTKQTPKRDVGEQIINTLERQMEGYASQSSLSIKLPSDTMSTMMGKRPSIQESPNGIILARTQQTAAQELHQLIQQNQQYKFTIQQLYQDAQADKEKLYKHDEQVQIINQEKRELELKCKDLNIEIQNKMLIINEKCNELDFKKLKIINITNELQEANNKLRIFQAKNQFNQIDHEEKQTFVNLPDLINQETQTEPLFYPADTHIRTPSHHSQGFSIKEYFPHTIPLPEYFSPLPLIQTSHGTQPLDFDVLPGYSSKSPLDPSNFSMTHPYQTLSTPQPLLPQGFAYNPSGSFPQTPHHHNKYITIINNKQDLNIMLEHQKEYEIRAMRLQNEINEQSEKIYKENIELREAMKAQKDEFKKKIKNSERYKERSETLQNEVQYYKKGAEDAERRYQDLRIKMEARVSEKEFKIISLKQQMKQLQQNFSMGTPGMATPAQVSMSNQGIPRMYSQHELFASNNIPSAVQQSKMISACLQTESSPLHPQRSRSYERSIQEETIRKQKHEQFQRLISPTIEDQNSSCIGRNESNSFIMMPPQSDISINDYSESMPQKRFESNIMMNTGRNNNISPVLSIYKSENLAHSQPKSYNQPNEELFQSVQRFNAKSSADFQQNQTQIVLAPQSFDSLTKRTTTPRALEISPFTNNQLRLHNDDSSPKLPGVPANTSQFNTIEQTEREKKDQQKEELREKIKKRADRIQMSRNKKSNGDNSFEKRSEKRGRSDSEINKKREVSEQLVTFSQEGVIYPKLNLEKIQINQGVSNSNNATFRKQQNTQTNSPQKNLNLAFDQAQSPFFQHQMNANVYHQNLSLSYAASPQNHTQNLSHQQSHQTPYLASQPPFQDPLCLPNHTTTFDYTPDDDHPLDQSQDPPPPTKLDAHLLTTLTNKTFEQTLQSSSLFSPQRIPSQQHNNHIESKTLTNQDYLKKLEIRERQSRSRGTKIKVQQSSNSSKRQMQRPNMNEGGGTQRLKFDRRRSSAAATEQQESQIINLTITNEQQVENDDCAEMTMITKDKKQRLEDIIRKYGRNNIQ